MKLEIDCKATGAKACCVAREMTLEALTGNGKVLGCGQPLGHPGRVGVVDAEKGAKVQKNSGRVDARGQLPDGHVEVAVNACHGRDVADTAAKILSPLRCQCAES